MTIQEITRGDGENYTCPICGEVLLKVDSDRFIWNEFGKLLGANVCPHLAYITTWGWDDMDIHFILVGKSYANRLVEKMNEVGLEFIKDEFELDYEITKDDISNFLNKNIPPEDILMGIFANLPFVKGLLNPDAICYSESYGVGFSGISIVIEP
jgi:hypothetical protein